MTVILLRHGRSTSNTAHTLAGRTEGVELDDKGRAQADALVERVDGLPIKALVRSPLLRFVAHHAMYWFVGYRVVVALVVMALLGTGVVAAG